MVAPTTDKKLILTEATESGSSEKPSKESSDLPLKQNGSKRSIVFDLEKNTTRLFEYEYKDLNDEEIWFTTDDHMNMKARSRSDAREWRRQGYSILLNETFRTPRTDAQDLLNAFVQLPDKLNRRGLERQCSQRHGEERSDSKDRARKSLLVAQEKLKRKGLNHSEITEKLAFTYIGECRAARVFARRLGKADELEIQRLRELEISGGNPDDSELVDRIMSQNGLLAQPDNLRKQLVRRMSNLSVQSGNSYDSQRQWVERTSHNMNNSSQQPTHHHLNNNNLSSSDHRGNGDHPRPSRQQQQQNSNQQPQQQSSSQMHHGNHRNSSNNSHSGGGGSISSSGRSQRRSRLEGGPPNGMGEDFYAAIA